MTDERKPVLVMAQTRKQTSPRARRASATGPASEDGRVSGVGQETDGAGEAREHTTTLRLPVLTVAITRHAVPASSGTGAMSETRGGGTVASRAGKLAFYGGIAALGVLEVVEWPVAVALGAGAYVVRRMSGGAGQAAVPSEGVAPKAAAAAGTANSGE